MQTIPKVPPLEWQQSNRVVSNQLIRIWQFNIKIIRWLGGQESNPFDRMILYPVEMGNYIRLMTEKGDARNDYLIELKNIIDTRILEQKSGFIIKRQDLLIEITFAENDSASVVKEKHSVIIDVEEKDAELIIDLVKMFRGVEEKSGFWTKSQVIYRDFSGREITSEIFLEAPFLAQDEKFRWIWWIIQSKDDRRTIIYLRALTNFRVFEYNYEAHVGRAIALKNIEDVQVVVRKEKRIDKSVTEYGIFTDDLKVISCNETNSTNIRTIGDVAFIVDGEPFATFCSIGNPEDIAGIVNVEKENILSYETQAQGNAIARKDWEMTDPFDIASHLAFKICAICHLPLGFTRYDPKKEWYINGKLCGDCFRNPTRLGVRPAADSRYACHMCGKNVPSLEFESESLCFKCFELKYGKVLLIAERGEYYGGHKVHLAGGTFGDYESGKMFLTEEHFIFAKGNKEIFKRWEIIIPLNSVLIEQWNVRGESRRKQIAGGGVSPVDNIAIGGGVIHETGQRHRLLIPYVDENGIVQQPVFGVSSYKGKDIRKWAETLYQQLVEEKQQQLSSDVNKSIQTDKDSDPISVLKLRYAKGEITKKEYEEMRKTIES